MNKETIGDRIKEKRKSKKITQKQLAKMLNKSESSIQKYESGEVEIPHSVVDEIARILETSVPYLLGYQALPHQIEGLVLFDKQLELLGCYYEEYFCPKEIDTEITGCKSANGIERYCSSCNIKQSYYSLTYNGITVKIPIHEFQNLRQTFQSYMRFMLSELIKKYQ